MGERKREVEKAVIDSRFWRGRRVFLTGHTGFKGAWAVLLLRSLGAEVCGFSLAPDNDRGLFVQAGVDHDVDHLIGDIRDLTKLQAAVSRAKPDVVILMAAQSLVRPSYEEPVDTFSTNVMGTVNLLEALRHVPPVAAVVIVTSDKCYENTASLADYRETDPMGGYDPYSSSKGCAEIVTAAYRRSFFQAKQETQVASARAGNVIGGGDWARDRLVPDLMRAFAAEKVALIRNPAAVRPWQHVMDPLIGYLVLAQRLTRDGRAFAEGWNFGPARMSAVPVSVLVEKLAGHWGAGARWEVNAGDHPHEATYLGLDCSKAESQLGWRPRIDLDLALQLTVEWYRELERGTDMRGFTQRQISQIIDPITDRGRRIQAH
jgi:CDP-glucose 4,6-dehydratase